MKMMRWLRHYIFSEASCRQTSFSVDISGFEVVGVLLGSIQLLISVPGHYAVGVRASKMNLSATSDEFTI